MASRGTKSNTFPNTLKTLIRAQIVIEWVAVQQQREYVALRARLFQPTERLFAVANAYPGPRILDGRDILAPVVTLDSKNRRIRVDQ